MAPGPVIRIAPYPRRWIVKSPPIVTVPAAAAFGRLDIVEGQRSTQRATAAVSKRSERTVNAKRSAESRPQAGSSEAS
jgi:hypothetical protein